MIDPMEPPWAQARDEELLAMRICDLGVRIEGSDLEPEVAQLHAELARRGVAMKPACYLADEWFTPVGLPVIAIPFYLAHPRLKALERSQVLEVEGGTREWCEQLLRHECGHAFDFAYKFSTRKKWRQLFGQPDAETTPEIYRPRPYSRNFVQHLPNWYAQAHPDEDFAETFAVVLGTPEPKWRAQYRGWKALEKLEYVDELITEAAQKPAPPVPSKRVSDVSKLRRTLARYYDERRKLFAEDYPDFYDADLREIFSRTDPSGGDSAARFMRAHRKTIVSSIVRWTGQRKYTVDRLVRRLTLRCENLGLPAPLNEGRVLLELASYLAALVTNHLHTGRFKRSV